MMIHHQTMLGFKQIIASEDIVETVVIILIIKAFAMTFILKIATQFVLQDILVHDDVPPYQVCYKRLSGSDKAWSD